MNKLTKILRYIPGFRSRNSWKMAVAVIYYLMSFSMINESIGHFLGILSLPFITFYLIDLLKYKTKGIPLFRALASFVVSFIVFSFAIAITPSPGKKQDLKQELAVNESTLNAGKQNTDNKKEDSAVLSNSTQKTVTGLNNKLGKAEKLVDNKKDSGVKSPVKLDKVKVIKHVDGDTIGIRFLDGSEEKVRFIGVNCPESTICLDPYGKEASAYTKSKLLGKTVYVEKDVSERDKYGRLLRYVWLDIPRKINENEIRQKMFNAVLLTNGYAQVSTYPPDVKYVDYFKKYERGSREADKGLWGIDLSKTSANAKTNYNIDNKAAQKKEAQYVGSAKSDKYHRLSCKWAKKISQSNMVYFKKIEEAKSKGYTACKVCNP